MRKSGECITFNKENWSLMGHIVADAKKLLEGFNSWDMNFVGRKANSTAHLVATLGAQKSVAREWLGEIPDCILEVIKSE
jgi:hypothetical protein